MAADSPFEEKSQGGELPPEVEAVGAAVRQLRGDRTQREVVAGSGLTISTFSSYENGKRMPTQAMRAKLAAALGVSLFQLEQTIWQHRSRHLLEQGRGERAALQFPGFSGETDPVQIRRAIQAFLDGLGQLLYRLFLGEDFPAAPGTGPEDSLP